MISYISPEIWIISLTEECPILEASLNIDDWSNDDDTLDF